MKPTVIGLTSWPNSRDGVLTRREPAPTTFAAPASMLRREIESDIVISLCNKRRRHPTSPAPVLGGLHHQYSERRFPTGKRPAQRPCIAELCHVRACFAAAIFRAI